jgi:hypothetical protein
MTEFEDKVLELLQNILTTLELKWLDLPDNGAVLMYKESEDNDALRKQTTSLQEGISATEGAK